MSYLVLARKFRPQTFHSIVGQEHITRALASGIIRKRTPHAFLFCGPRGVGKTTCARVLARALNCTGRALPTEEQTTAEDPSSLVEPCGECPNCVEIARSSSIAVWEIDGASNNSVDNVRELIDSLRSLPPPGSQYKIYIIDEVHMLSVAAFNALLKSLEEPPPNTIFIFATTEAHKIPETVISRCQRHDFRKIPLSVISRTLAEISAAEGVAVEADVFDFIARRAQGGMRDAQSMLDRLFAFDAADIDLALAQRIFGVVESGMILKLGEAILSEQAETAIACLDRIFQESVDLRGFLGDFLQYWRNLLLISSTEKVGEQVNPSTDPTLRGVLELTPSEFETLKQHAGKKTTFDLQRLFDCASEIVELGLRSHFARYVVEAGVVKLALLPSLKPLGEVLATLGGGLPPERPGRAPHVGSPPAVSSSKAEIKAPLASSPTTSAISEPAVVKATLEEQADERPFDPSWTDFLRFVRSRRELRLEAFLQRVSPVKFTHDTLALEAQTFVLSAIQDDDTLKALRTCLHAYSGNERWNVSFSEHIGEERSLTNDSGKDQATPASAVPGSQAANKHQARQELKKKIETEARTDELVQNVLSTFEGSTIEKVSVLKR